jgi:GNAT superfamily N-acetyltransferase
VPLNSNAPNDIIALSTFKMSTEMIEVLSAKDASIVYEVINKAASAYRGIIPEDCYHEPYMPEGELLQELQRMIFFGWCKKTKIVGVIGFQKVREVTLVRHAYVLPEYQKKGIGTNLLNHVKHIKKTKRLLVGTWEDAVWAIQFYQKHGFRLMPDKDKLLRKYWDIPQRQIETSVVLGIET